MSEQMFMFAVTTGVFVFLTAILFGQGQKGTALDTRLPEDTPKPLSSGGVFIIISWL